MCNGPWRQGYISPCCALSLEQFGTKFCPREISVCNYHSRTCFANWWEEAASKVPKQDRRQFNGIIIYIVWNLWKERNRRIFNNAQKTGQQVAYLTKEDIMQRRGAVSFDR